jgi:hypothetical protein
MGTKWLELLKEIAPGIARVAVIFNPKTAPSVASVLRSIEAAAPAFAVSVTADRVLHPAERNITDKGGKESSAMDTLLRRDHDARGAS